MFFPERNHRITREQANQFKIDFIEKYPDEIMRFVFHADQLRELAAVEGCSHLGIYNGYSVKEDRKVLVLAPLDEKGNDIGQTYMQFSYPCPPICSNEFPRRDHTVTKAEADYYRNEFKKRFPDELKRRAYDIAQVMEILGHKLCVYFSVFNGYDETEKEKVFVLCGLTKQGKEIAIQYMEFGLPCPPWCSAEISSKTEKKQIALSSL